MIKLRVLVVDDMVDTVDSFIKLVQGWGYDCQGAYDGFSAMSIVQLFKPHVVMLDIIMPLMDGYTVAKNIREVAHHDIIIIGVTALQEDIYRHKGWDTGFDFFLVKPVVPDKLKLILSNVARTIEIKEKTSNGIKSLVKKLQGKMQDVK